MLATLVLATTLAATPQLVQLPGPDDYKPSGPKIEFTMMNDDKFVITTDPKRSPKTVAHILNLVRSGFYDRQRVHRVEWWVTQWGAPASRDQPMDVMNKTTGKMEQNEKVGDGGSGKDIEVFEGAKDVDYYRGVVGVASTGLQVPGDSQLFILKRDAFRLWNSYAVVGKVTSGMDAVGRIVRGARIKRAVVLGEAKSARSSAVR